jgi:hypothetical protein
MLEILILPFEKFFLRSTNCYFAEIPSYLPISNRPIAAGGKALIFDFAKICFNSISSCINVNFGDFPK